MEQQPAQQEEGARSFARLLEQLADGEVQQVMSEEVHRVCVALRDESEARRAKVSGSVALNLKITADGGIVEVEYQVDAKTPKPKRAKSVMWLTRGGNLTPHNPKQQDLPGIREVGGNNQPARDVGSNEGEAPREVIR